MGNDKLNIKPALFTIIIVVLWQMSSLIIDLPLPTPKKIAEKTITLTYPKPILLKHLEESVKRLLVGYLLAVVIGVLTGIAMGLEEKIKKTLNPLMGFMISIPTIAWVPLFLITLGLGEKTIIAAIFLGGFFAVAYNTLRGIELVEKNMLWAAETMGIGRRKKIVNVIIPASMTSIITGARLGIGYCWRALVGAEMLAATQYGLGYMIYAARAFQDISTMFVGLVLIGILSYLSDHMLVTKIEEKTINRWGVKTQHG